MMSCSTKTLSLNRKHCSCSVVYNNTLVLINNTVSITTVDCKLVIWMFLAFYFLLRADEDIKTQTFALVILVLEIVIINVYC